MGTARAAHCGAESALCSQAVRQAGHTARAVTARPFPSIACEISGFRSPIWVFIGAVMIVAMRCALDDGAVRAASQCALETTRQPAAASRCSGSVIAKTRQDP